ncbi:MAG TPA: pre-peptidase C-terminal domain-containing protein [Polyangiales bacterium]|nr:pre-peptidase C-terminal domain-containing protein [Polyangiales bacterium]
MFGNFIVPDVYTFFANPGEQIRLQTSNNGDPNAGNLLDTTIRVIGPDASTNLFDDDGGGNLASRLTFTTTRAGEYTVVVSTFAGNPIGANDNNGNYVLTLARGGALLPLVADPTAKAADANTAVPAETPVVEKK